MKISFKSFTLLALTFFAFASASIAGAQNFEQQRQYIQFNIDRVIGNAVQSHQISMNSKNYHPDYFSGEVAGLLAFYEHNGEADWKNIVRPLSIIRSMRFLGITRVNYNIPSFIDAVFTAVREAGFENTAMLNLDDFGMIDLKSILQNTQELDFSEDSGNFVIDFKNKCDGGCSLPLDKMQTAITGFKLKDVKISGHVRMSFSETPDSLSVKNQAQSMLTGGKFTATYVNAKVRDWLSRQGYGSNGAYHPPAAVLSISGLEFHGSFAKLPLKGSPKAIFLLPGLAADQEANSPTLVVIAGSAVLIPGSVMVSDNQ